MKTVIDFYYKNDGRSVPATLDLFVGRDAVVYQWTNEYHTNAYPAVDCSRLIPRHDITWRETNEV